MNLQILLERSVSLAFDLIEPQGRCDSNVLSKRSISWQMCPKRFSCVMEPGPQVYVSPPVRVIASTVFYNIIDDDPTAGSPCLLGH